MAKTDSSFAHKIIEWYQVWGRDLPWRRTRDPYAIWLSEVILQQTRIEQGLDYWRRFMKRWPRVADLAAASEDEVLRMWQGLGYYNRARNLHATAQQIAGHGTFPDTKEELQSLKGVGEYTASAIASFAFQVPVAVVDGNVYRVLSRHFGITTPINSTEGKKKFAMLAQDLLPRQHADIYNQGIMDFGATWCTPKSPHCDGCPLMETCEALHSHQVENLPVKLRATSVKTRRLRYVYMRCQGETAIHRRAAGDIWQGLWEPPLYENESLPNFKGKLTLLKKGQKHVLTHRILITDFYLLETETKPQLPLGYKWIAEDTLDDYAIPRLIEILLEILNNHSGY